MKMYRFKYQETYKEPKIDFFEVQEIRDGTEYILKIGTYVHTIFDGDVGKSILTKIRGHLPCCLCRLKRMIS